MATIKFFIQSKNNPAGIYVRLREGRTIDAKAKTNYLVSIQDWSTAKGLPKEKDEGLKVLKENLDDLKSKLQKQYNIDVDHKAINSEWLKDFINPAQTVTGIPDKLITYIDYYQIHKKNAIGSSTYKRNNVYKHLIERFEKSTLSNYRIKDVDSNFKLRFEAFGEKNSYAPNTIARTIVFIKTICRHARSNGIETNFQLDNIKVILTKIDKIYLTTTEIEKIEKVEFTADYLDNARDWLIISCETGQRVSDYMRFNKDMIRYESDVPLIEFTQVKTEKIMSIPLSKKVIKILDKRHGDFPRQISDQKFNKYIKDVCKIADITEIVVGGKLNKKTNRKETGMYPKYGLVTSHIGRRSFATNNYGRIPTSLLINVTGHSTESMFLQYIGKTATDKAIQLAEYFK